MSHVHGVAAATSVPASTILERAREMLRTLLDGMPEPVTLFDIDRGEPVYANVAARALPAEVRAFLDQAALAGAVAHGERLARVLELVDASGGTRVFESLTFPISPVTAGRPLMIHSARDVTARWHVERRGEQDERLRLIGTMAAGLAHEIRNPLTSISNGARALKDMLPDVDGDARHIIEVFAKEAGRVARLLTDFLSFARPRPPRLAAEDLGGLVGEAVAVARRCRPEAEAVVVDVSAGSVPVEALVDRDQIMQAVLNVLVNALDACLDGQSRDELRVTVRLAPPADGDRFCRVTVLDSGPGIAPEDRPRLFEPFFSRKPNGTGLGLAISRRLVETHGGRLEVGEAPGGGAAFVLHLPAARGGG